MKNFTYVLMNANKIFFVIESSEEIMMKDTWQTLQDPEIGCILSYNFISFYVKINLGIRCY